MNAPSGRLLEFSLDHDMSKPDQTSIGEYQKISNAPLFFPFAVWLSTEFFLVLSAIVLDAFCATSLVF